MGSPRNFIGASDMPALLGLGDATEDDLAARILRGVEREVSPDVRALMDRGTRREPALLDTYERLYDVRLLRGERRVHPEYPFLSAAPDGVYESWRGNIVECKTRHRNAQMAKDPTKKFGYAGSGDIPAKYAAQVQFQLECFDAETAFVWVDFGVDTDDGEWVTHWLARYVVPRDREFGRDLVRLAVAFWERRISPFMEAA